MCSRSTAEREADRRQRPPEARQEIVVAPAAADRHAVGRVVDLEDGTGVVAEAADETEVEDHALGDRVGASSECTARIPAPASCSGPVACSSTSGPPRMRGTAQQQLGVGVAEPQRRRARARHRRSRRRRAWRGSARGAIRARRATRAAPGTASRRRARRGSSRGRRRAARRRGPSAPRRCPPAPARRSARSPPAGTRATARAAVAPAGRRARNSRSAAASARARSASRPARAIGTVMSGRSTSTLPCSSNSR